MTLHLLRNADLYTPDPAGRAHLLVAGDRVAWIGTEVPELPASLLASDRDLEGRRVIPGLVDSHVHLTGGGGEGGYGSSLPPLAARDFVSAGVTTAVGLLGTDDTVRTPGSLVQAAYGLRAAGLSAWCWTGGYHLPPATVTGSVRGDIVHIDPVIGVGEVALSDHRSSQPGLGALLQVAADAHVGGLMTGKAGVLHLHIGDGPRGLDLLWQALSVSELPPRTFHPTHVNRRKALYEEAAELAGRGVTVDVTAFPVAEGEDAWGAPDAVIRWLDAGHPADRLTVSSDAGGSLPVFDAEGGVVEVGIGRPEALAGALAELLRRGVPLEAALPCFTSTPAQLLRLPGKGRLAVGSAADLVVLSSEGSVDDVMAMGRWMNGRAGGAA